MHCCFVSNAWKASLFEVFLVRIFLHSDWIGIDTEYLSAFYPNVRKYGPEKLRRKIRTRKTLNTGLFRQCSGFRFCLLFPFGYKVTLKMSFVRWKQIVRKYFFIKKGIQRCKHPVRNLGWSVFFLIKWTTFVFLVKYWVSLTVICR